MKKVLIGLLALSSISAFAKDRVHMTKSLFNEIRDSGKHEQVNVYVNLKTIIERRTGYKANTEVGNNVHKSLQRNVLKEVIPRRAKGRIIDIEGDYYKDECFKSRKEAKEQENLKLYVSFGTCNDRSCAFKFVYDGMVDYDSWRSTYNYCAEGRGNYFRLDGLPESETDYSNISIELRKNIFRKLDRSGQNSHFYMPRFYEGPVLEIDLDEVKKTIYKKINYGGAR